MTADVVFVLYGSLEFKSCESQTNELNDLYNVSFASQEKMYDFVQWLVSQSVSS
jgi:hypothetical protein